MYDENHVNLTNYSLKTLLIAFMLSHTSDWGWWIMEAVKMEKSEQNRIDYDRTKHIDYDWMDVDDD